MRHSATIRSRPPICKIYPESIALGISREKHHRYLMGNATMKGFVLRSGNERVGYVYVNPDGHIGPLAVTRPDAMGGAFQTALKLAAERGSPQVTALIPGTSDALSVAVDHGMRITFPMLLMSSRDFGDWNCYLPRNPGFAPFLGHARQLQNAAAFRAARARRGSSRRGQPGAEPLSGSRAAHGRRRGVSACSTAATANGWRGWRPSRRRQCGSKRSN